MTAYFLYTLKRIIAEVIDILYILSPLIAGGLITFIIASLSYITDLTPPHENWLGYIFSSKPALLLFGFCGLISMSLVNAVFEKGGIGKENIGLVIEFHNNNNINIRNAGKYVLIPIFITILTSLFCYVLNMDFLGIWYYLLPLYIYLNIVSIFIYGKSIVDFIAKTTVLDNRYSE